MPVIVIFGDNDGIRKGYLEPLKEAHIDWPIVYIQGANHITCIFKRQFREDFKSGWPNRR